MRTTMTLIALAALGAGCATQQAAKAPDAATPAAATAAPFVIEFADATTLTNKGGITQSNYSQNPDDTKMEARKLVDGALVVSGQVGMGKGSQWAGIGVMLPAGADNAKVNLARHKTVTFNLAASGTGSLRLRLVGDEQAIRDAGCYPVYVQAVTETLSAYTIDVTKFAAEGWCGPKARDVTQALAGFTGVEVADPTIQKKPVSFSIGKISVNP